MTITTIDFMGAETSRYVSQSTMRASFDIDSFHQNYEPIHSLLTGPRALQSNLVYLENQVYKFQAKPGGREWTVYGSPVCYQLFRVFPLC